jgi:hypothetical protein
MHCQPDSMVVLIRLDPAAVLLPSSLVAYQHQQQEHNHSSCYRQPCSGEGGFSQVTAQANDATQQYVN